MCMLSSTSTQCWHVVALVLTPQRVDVQRLGRRVATAHLLQLILLFYLGAVLKSQHMTAPGQLRASFAIFGIIYALQVDMLVHKELHSRFSFCCELSAIDVTSPCGISLQTLTRGCSLVRRRA